MPSFLYFNRLDDDLFPELQPGPGRKGLQGRVMVPPVDQRIPAPSDAEVLLAVFRLDEPPRVQDPASAPTGWTLEYTQRDADGVSRRHAIALIPTPKDGNYSSHPVSDPTVLPLPRSRPF